MQLKKLTRVDHIVIHCAATKPTLDIGVREIDAWHRKQGWVKVGYHFVIRRNGVVEEGRAVDEVGSHAMGHNSTSLGVCLVGGLNAEGAPANNFTPAQWTALETLVRRLKTTHPNAEVLGHRDLPNVKKDCPCFPAKTWWQSVITK